MSRQATNEEVAMREQAADRRFDQRRREVEAEIDFTLNVLDRVEDDTRRLYARMLRETRSAYDTRNREEF